MPHHITGLIGTERTFQALVPHHIGNQPRVPLAGKWTFVPLDDENVEVLLGPDVSGEVGNFEYLTLNLLDLLCMWSAAGDLAYVETCYHGGDGAQGAVVAQNGHIVFGPTEATLGPINAALAILGVRTSSSSALDNFDALGLGQHRSNRSFRLGAR